MRKSGSSDVSTTLILFRANTSRSLSNAEIIFYIHIAVNPLSQDSFTYLELAVNLHRLTQRRRPTRRSTTEHAAARRSAAKHHRAKSDVPEGFIRRGHMCLILEEIGHARMWREPEHVLGPCRKRGYLKVKEEFEYNPAKRLLLKTISR
jgi:hypothetical protein